MSATLAEDVIVLDKVGGNIICGYGLNISNFFGETLKNKSILDPMAETKWYWPFNCKDLLTDTIVNKVAISNGIPEQDTLLYNNFSYPCVKLDSTEYLGMGLIYNGSVNENTFQKTTTISFIFNTDKIVYGSKIAQGHHTTGTAVLLTSNLFGLHFTYDNTTSLTLGIYNSNGDYDYCYTSGINFQINTSYHVTCVLDAATSSAKIYIDGILRGSSTISGIVQTYYDANVYFNWSTTSNQGNIKIANFKLIKKALSASEVLTLSTEEINVQVFVPIKISTRKHFPEDQEESEDPVDTSGWYHITFNSDTYGDYDLDTLTPTSGFGGTFANHSLDSNNYLTSTGASSNNSFKSRVVDSIHLEADRNYTDKSTTSNYRCKITWDPNTRTWDRTDNVDYWLYPINQTASNSHSLGVITSDPRFLCDVYDTNTSDSNSSGEYSLFPKNAFIYLHNGERIEEI